MFLDNFLQWPQLPVKLYIKDPHICNTHNNQKPYEDHFFFYKPRYRFARRILHPLTWLSQFTSQQRLAFTLWSQKSNSRSCLKDALHVYHPLLAKLELLPHLLNLDVIASHEDLGYVPIIGQDHLDLDLFFPWCFCPVVHSPGASWRDSYYICAGSFIMDCQEMRVAETYAKGLRVISQNQLLPPSGTAIDRTSPTLPRLMQVQKVSSAACPLLGTIVPSKLSRNTKIFWFTTNSHAKQVP